jgi:ABC-type glycerol-3-phosphate transport system permease component
MTEGRRDPLPYRIAIFVLLLIGVAPVIMPLYWLFLGSVKTQTAMNKTPPDWLPIDEQSFITIFDQELRVSVFDDGSHSGSGVARVKLAQTGGQSLRVPRSELERLEVDEFTAEIDGVRRPVEPLSDLSGDTVEVRVPGILRQVDVPIDSVEVHAGRRVIWSVLGQEIALSEAPDPLPESGNCVVHWETDASPLIEVDPALFDAERRAVHPANSDLMIPVKVEQNLTPGGFAVVRLACPTEGLSVPAARLRTSEHVERFATINGERRAVRILTQDRESGTATAELPDEAIRREVPTAGIERKTRTVYRANLLGVEMELEPVPVSPDAADSSDALPVRVDGAISILASRVRTEAPVKPRWANYAAAWKEQTFDLYVANTLFIAALVVLGTVLSCGLVGYAFARLVFRGRDTLFLLLLATMMIPPQVMSIPTFVMFVKFGWIDTYLPLIVPQMLAQAAFFVFLFRQFMMTIPVDLEDSARIDGCGPLATWWLIMMPMAKPIIVTVAVFAFVNTWNDFLMPLLYINSDEKQTVALGLQSFKSAYQGADPQLIMAASVMMIIPSIILFFLAQKAFIRGVVVSGVKG